ncbi:MAG: phosphoribosylformylglycinamidine cyclo-ligase [Planctomycetota bacterium]
MTSRLTYRDAGVDIDKKGRMLRDIGALVRTTFGPGVRHELGAFGGMFSGRFEGMRHPILVASNDGVGTKTRLALRAGRLKGLGHDIVNHCVNDVLVQGAEPLFFLDYLAASHLDPHQFEDVLTGLVEACRAAGAALLGGETAEMPGTYLPGEMDLVGFLVGVVEADEVWPRGIAPGQALIGVRSNGLHTNGYSLVNRLIERDAIDLATTPEGWNETLADALCRPHRSYLAPIRALRKVVAIRGLAHITGGGLEDNVPRVLPEGVEAVVDRSSFAPNPVFRWIVERTGIDAAEAWHVFNMGCGLVVVVDEAQADKAVAVLREAGEDAWRLGHTAAGARGVRFLDA